jgi:hypothetical protein
MILPQSSASAVRPIALLESALLTVVIATALLSAGAARAILQNNPAECDALTAERACVGVPSDEGVLDTLFIMSDTGAGGDPLFSMVATETDIVLFFTEFATGNALDGTGFALTGLDGIPDLVAGDLEVRFVGDWGVDNQDIPVLSPFVTEDLASVQWTSLAGGDPSGGGVAVISLNFVPEPGTALLMGLGLAGLGIAGRPRQTLR